MCYVSSPVPKPKVLAKRRVPASIREGTWRYMKLHYIIYICFVSSHSGRYMKVQEVTLHNLHLLRIFHRKKSKEGGRAKFPGTTARFLLRWRLLPHVPPFFKQCIVAPAGGRIVFSILNNSKSKALTRKSISTFLLRFRSTIIWLIQIVRWFSDYLEILGFYPPAPFHPSTQWLPFSVIPQHWVA